MFTSAALCFLTLSTLAQQEVDPAYRQGYEKIDKTEIHSWIEFLSSDELAGRDTGTAGYNVASKYVASEMQGMGVEPGNNGSFFQPFTMVRRQRLLNEAHLSIKGPDGKVERIELKGKVGVVSRRDVHWKDRWVFAGKGAGSDSDSRDAFHGLPIKDSVVLIAPDKGAAGRWAWGARAAGARRVVVVSDEQARRRLGSRLPQRARYRIEAEWSPAGDDEIVYITSDIADRLLSRWDTSLEKARSSGSRGMVLDGVEIELVVELKEIVDATRNVVGFIPGSDPKLRDEAVVIGGHLDHVGQHDDKIFNGADDNASGSTALLAICRALMANSRRPRRSTVIVFFSAEERGLHGSRYYVDNPTLPIEKMVCMFNMDMVGRNEERRDRSGKVTEKAEDNVDCLHVIGSKRHSLELDPWIHKVNGPVGFKFEYDEEGVWNRSDQYNFAAKGVPVTFFFAGFHADYHKPTDTIEKINFDKVARVARLVYSLVFEVGDRPRRLRNNRL